MTNNTTTILKEFRFKFHGAILPTRTRQQTQEQMESWLALKLQEVEREAAMKIVANLEEWKENPGNAEIATIQAIQWGIAKGWGFDFKEVAEYRKQLSHLKEGEQE